ncbi:MAG: DNA internalization-related competence protein ComEC/Rec2 [Mariprofundaceae bacterium]|nr:DNA internalization-related competence protein ComEC/Rec2 [Mariprofundaceae bacterium]
MLDLRAMPLFVPTLTWVLGLAAARMNVVSWQLDVVLFAVLCVAWAVRWQRLFCLWGILGLLWGGIWLLNDARQVIYDASWVGQDVVLQADVESVRTSSTSTRLRLKHVQRNDGEVLAGKVDVYVWYEKTVPQIGQSVRLTAKLKAPVNRYNPGGFDYQGYCFDRHIALIGGVRGKIDILNSDTSLLNHLRAKVQAVLPNEAAQRGVLQALLLAKRDNIPIQIQEAFAATGAAHLLAISGLHVGMVAAWGAMLCWWLLTRREAWIVRFPVRHCSLAVGVLCAIFYATLAGWPLPTQRAALMLGAAALAWWLRARYQPVNTLLLALMLILLWDAAAVLSISLWLSFVASLALVFFAHRYEQESQSKSNHISRYIKSLIIVSLVASLATLPLIADVFGRLPVWSLPANLLLVPLYGGWVLPWALLGEISALLNFHSLAETLMVISGYGIDMGNVVLMHMHTWVGGNLWLPDISLVWGVFYVSGMLCGALLWFRKQRSTAMILISGTLFLYSYGVATEGAPTTSRFIAWDVGQGAAASLIQVLPNKPAHVLVVDVPGRKGSRFNGGTTVASGLRALGLTHIDVLMLSHAQSDHAGGALRLLDSMRDISELWLADVPANHDYHVMQKAVARIQQQGGLVRWLKQGDVLQIGEIKVHVLWPPAGYAPDNDNNTSLVCTLEMASGKRILLSGDMESPVEHALLGKGALQPHTLMLMPHHGSRTSSTISLVQRVQPSIVIAQTGRDNHFNFPKDDVVQRYKDVGSDVWNTANGAITWSLSDGKVSQFNPLLERKRDVALQWVDLLL